VPLNNYGLEPRNVTSSCVIVRYLAPSTSSPFTLTCRALANPAGHKERQGGRTRRGPNPDGAQRCAVYACSRTRSADLLLTALSALGQRSCCKHTLFTWPADLLSKTCSPPGKQICCCLQYILHMGQQVLPCVGIYCTWFPQAPDRMPLPQVASPTPPVQRPWPQASKPQVPGPRSRF